MVDNLLGLDKTEWLHVERGDSLATSFISTLGMLTSQKIVKRHRRRVGKVECTLCGAECESGV